jgi:pimeloyl-ACP methyl ester carboxylesterase
METKHYENGAMCLNYAESGTGGVLLHLAHANGFPAGVYEPLIENLARDRRVIGLNICGQSECIIGTCGNNHRIASWHKLALEQYSFLRDMAGGRRIVAAGHSIGGIVTILNAVKHPELFKKLILLDPVLLEPGLVRFIRMMRILRQQHRAPLAVRARKRRNGWQSRDEAFDFFSGKSLFSDWDEASVRAYVTYGMKDGPDGGVELACPPEMEAQGFESYPTDIWRQVRKLCVPVLFVRGGDSDTLTPRARDLFLRLLPGADFMEIPGAGHLFPMQQPEYVANIIREYVG